MIHRVCYVISLLMLLTYDVQRDLEKIQDIVMKRAKNNR